MRSLAVLFALALAIPVSAQLPPLVKSALDSVPDHKKWAFTETTVEEGKKTVQKFDPSRPEGEQWQLVLKEGHAPSASELAEYAKEKAKHGGGNRKKTTLELDKMIRPGSLRMIRESAADVVYEFRLPVDEGDDAKGRETIDLMRGRLTIAKAGPTVQVLEIENEKPINPVVSVNIQRMYTKMTFRSPAAGLPPLLAEVHAIVRGRALFVKKLDTDTVATYSEYRAVTGSR